MAEADFIRRLRHEIYHHFVQEARAPTTGWLAARLKASMLRIEKGLTVLAEAREIVLLPGTTRIWMAHPFASGATPYPVECCGRHYFGNCAWDALGIAALLERDSITLTHCPDCGAEMDVGIRDGILSEIRFGPTRSPVSPDEAVVHFAVPARYFWDDIGFT